MEKTLQGTRAPKGLFVGLTTIDIIFALEGYPKEDTKNTAREYAIAAGGPATNAAIVFSYLGGVAELLSSLGRSVISNIARSDLASHRVRHVDIAPNCEREPALSAIAISGACGSRTILTSPAIDDEVAGPFQQEERSVEIAGKNILLLDGHQTQLAVHMARLAREAGVTVVLDGDLYRQGTEDILPFVDVVIFGKSFNILGNAKNEDLFRYFESFGIKHVVSTHGEKPVRFLSDGVLGTIEVEGVLAVDTLGAGDFFHGAFCYAYSNDRDIQRALKFAAKVASSSVTRFGTRDWMKEYEPSDFE